MAGLEKLVHVKTLYDIFAGNSGISRRHKTIFQQRISKRKEWIPSRALYAEVVVLIVVFVVFLKPMNARLK